MSLGYYDPDDDFEEEDEEDPDEPRPKKKKVARVIKPKLTKIELKEGMTKKEAKTFLTQMDYCTQHLIPLIEERRGDKGKDVVLVCLECRYVRDKERTEKIKKAIRVLGGKGKSNIVEIGIAEGHTTARRRYRERG